MHTLPKADTGFTGCLALLLTALIAVGSATPAAAQHHIFPITFDDQNCNGVWDGGETGLEGWTVYLDVNGNGRFDAGEPSTVTDVLGIGDLPVAPGTYEVAAVVPEGRALVAPPPPGTQALSVPPDQEAPFGSLAAAVVEGVVYDDQDGNGQQDAGEPGLDGWTLNLDGTTCAGDALAQTTETEADGTYAFEGLPPGTYEVSAAPADDWTQTQPSDDGAYVVTVLAGEQAGPLVFGLRRIVTQAFDFGDAPDTYGTTLVKNGPRHVLVPGGVTLGATVDPEADGQPESEALGDDHDGVDDEDGVRFVTPLVPGKLATVEVRVASTTAAFLYAWIDFDGDGRFTDLPVQQPGGERIISGSDVGTGVHQIQFLVPADAIRMGLARFRVTTFPLPLSPLGEAPDGEVEDHVLLDYGDAPDPRYPTLRGRGSGARHFLSTCFLGDPGAPPGLEDAPDAEPDGQPSNVARGDDGGPFAAPADDDEDGVVFNPPTPIWLGLEPLQGAPFLVRGTTVSMTVFAACAGALAAWIDWNGDGDWDDPGEHIFENDARRLRPGPNEVTFEVPEAAAKSGRVADPLTTFARFRFSSSDAGIAFPHVIDVVPDGEVEDHLVHVVDLDCGDAPFGTLLPGGACHAIEPGFYLGYRDPDREFDGQPSLNALGDDGFFFGYDDEDGIFFQTAQVSGEQATIRVRASQPGLLSYDVYDLNLNAWVRVFAQPVNPGFNSISFLVPNLVAAGQPTMRTYGRFRLTSAREGFAAAVGPAGSGEVEDYRVNILAPSGGGSRIAASISGQKFDDLDGNGVQDPGEPGLDGWTIQLLDDQGAVLSDVTTSSLDLDGDGVIDPEAEQGLYTFQGQDPGQDGQTLVVREVAQEGWMQTLPAWPDTAYTLLLQRGNDVDDVDFGNTRRGALQGTVFEDANANGVRDEDEVGLANWFVFADRNANGVLDEGEPGTLTMEDNPATTGLDEAGWFWVGGLEAGEYVVAEQQQEGWTLTFPEGDGTHTVFVGSGESVEGIDFGNRQVTSVAVEEESSGLPTAFLLHQNYPNPFNPETIIRFDVAAQTHVVVEVFDLLGRSVVTLVDAPFAPGRHAVRFDAGRLPSGLYLYRIEAGAFRAIKTMVLAR